MTKERKEIKLRRPPVLRPCFYLRHPSSILFISSPDNTGISFVRDIHSLAILREPTAYESVPCYFDLIPKIRQKRLLIKISNRTVRLRRKQIYNVLYGILRHSCNVTFQRNWTVQTDCTRPRALRTTVGALALQRGGNVPDRKVRPHQRFYETHKFRRTLHHLMFWSTDS